MKICPCGSGRPYDHCCGPFHNGIAKAETAEQLMRSRYAAFCTENVEYLVETHDKDTRVPKLREELQNSMGSAQWLRLEVINTIRGQSTDKDGFVQFIAHYSENGQPGKMEELSRFSKKKGLWFYTDGEHSN